jgi:hypothetical protein
MVKHKYGIVMAGKLDDPEVKSSALKAKKLYLNEEIDRIIFAGKEKEARGLEAFLSGSVSPEHMDIDLDSKIDYILDNFKALYKAPDVERVCFIGPKKYEQEFNKSAEKILEGYPHDFQVVQANYDAAHAEKKGIRGLFKKN